jgi:integrative and conjugative element protein (TIGR02256 family)
LSEILVSELAESCILAAASGAHPNEAGGILIGVRADTKLWITHALEIPPATAGPTHYVLPAGVTHPLITCVRRIDRRLGYVGEWHVHPADTGPSPTDRRTMAAVAVVSPSPVLAIARLSGSAYHLDVRLWRNGRLLLANLIRTGALIPVENLESVLSQEIGRVGLCRKPIP